jgi:hypothetical protein
MSRAFIVDMYWLWRSGGYVIKTSVAFQYVFGVCVQLFVHLDIYAVRDWRWQSMVLWRIRGFLLAGRGSALRIDE